MRIRNTNTGGLIRSLIPSGLSARVPSMFFFKDFKMLIQFSTDHHIGHHPSLHGHVDALVRKTLHPFRSHITRVDVHLTDENAHANHANDKRCVMEARLDGVQPLVVTATASNVAAVLDAASRKLRRSVVRVEAKRRSRRVRTRLV